TEQTEQTEQSVEDGETQAEEQSAPEQPVFVSVASVEILTDEDLDDDPENDDDDIIITTGEKLRLTVRVLPENASLSAVVWQSDNAQVLTVDADGNAEATGAGKAAVRAFATDGSGVYGELEITVIAPEEDVPEETVTEEPTVTEAP
ncbi:MAG: Ig-like domain-containing protein, partial [Eubacteriales bacterium]|nr:Ig-like domain-containing protein [Eubacteriales bacterium]